MLICTSWARRIQGIEAVVAALKVFRNRAWKLPCWLHRRAGPVSASPTVMIWTLLRAVIQTAGVGALPQRGSSCRLEHVAAVPSQPLYMQALTQSNTGL